MRNITLKSVKGVVSPYPKADLGKRIVAGTSDAGICLLCYVVLLPAGFGVAAILGASYLLVRDGLFSGQSVGKRFAGLMVIHVGDGAPCAIWRSVGRNILLVIPGVNVVAVFFEFAVALCDEQGMRLGDRIARTQVVEGKDVKDLAAALCDHMLRSLFEVKEANVSQGKYVEEDVSVSPFFRVCRRNELRISVSYISREDYRSFRYPALPGGSGQERGSDPALRRRVATSPRTA